MNPVHAVLRNWDILQTIMNFVKEDCNWVSGLRDLVAVALVCRALSDLALDVLWRDINLPEVHFLFPMDMIHVRPGGSKFLTRIPTTPQEWERFDVYAPRIRKIWATRSTNDLFLRGLRMRHPTFHHPFPFPNLTCLMSLSSPSDVVDAITLICPTLTEVRFLIEKLSEDENEDDDAVADFLRSVGETCPRLRRFEYNHYSILTAPTSRSKAVESSIIYLIHQCRRLEYAELPVSRDILRALASLPHLSTLVLDHATWEDGSQLYLPTEADEWIEEAYKFPVLDDLTIQGSHTVSSLTECFQASGCFPRTSFTMRELSECEQWSTVAIAEFFRGILRPDRSEGSLTIDINRETAVQNPVGHDPWQALSCLSLTPNLGSLSLDGLFLEINDTDLEEMTRIWPELGSLHLDVPYTDEYQSQISFQGLAHLSTLKILKSVSLMLAPDSTISESMISTSTSSNSPLNHLTIRGKFPPVTPYAAATFLLLHFPRLESIEASLHSDTGEKERMIEIQVLFDVERTRMENLLSDFRNCRSRTGVAHEGGAD